MSYLKDILKDIETGKKSPLQAITGDKPVSVSLSPETKKTIIGAVSILGGSLIIAALISTGKKSR